MTGVNEAFAGLRQTRRRSKSRADTERPSAGRRSPTVAPAPAAFPERLARGPQWRVASWNVHKCVGTDGRFDPHRTAQVIAELRADLVGLQEVDRRFGRRVGLLARDVLEETGLELLPVSPLADGHGWHGNALLLRRGAAEVADIRRLDLPGAEPRGALVVDLAPRGGGRLRVVAAHLGLLRRSRRQQVAALVEAIGDAPGATLLLGDCNEWRHPLTAGCSLRGLRPVFGEAPRFPDSFPARLPVLALDRILGAPHGLLGPVTAHHSALARVASDHLPLAATLRVAATSAPPARLEAAA